MIIECVFLNCIVTKESQQCAFNKGFKGFSLNSLSKKAPFYLSFSQFNEDFQAIERQYEVILIINSYQNNEERLIKTPNQTAFRYNNTNLNLKNLTSHP